MFLCGSVVKCVTHNLESPGSSLWVFPRSVLGQGILEPRPSIDKTQEIKEKVSCCSDNKEIMLKGAYNSIPSIQSPGWLSGERVGLMTRWLRV